MSDRNRLVLLGDSILDNRPYVGQQPDTSDCLRRVLGDRWSVQLLARDGAVMSHIAGQLEWMEDRPDLVVLSVGGNDVTGHRGLLLRQNASAAVIFGELLAIADRFGTEYEQAARAVAERAKRTVLCTIYDVQLEPPELARLVRVPLAVLNDRIVQAGARLGLEVLELRHVCTSPADFVLEIEPSAQGARKIADSIAKLAEGGSPPAVRITAPQ
jgi:lysophospholipase L1-like esterase